jgi:hypothetical protein
MRQVDEQVRQRRDEVQMPDGVRDDVSRIKKAKEPEVSARGARAYEAADERERAETKVPDVDKRRHGKEPKHFSVCIHDAGDEIHGVNEEKKRGEPEGELLQGSDRTGHADDVTARTDRCAGILRVMRSFVRRLVRRLWMGAVCAAFAGGSAAQTAAVPDAIRAEHDAMFADFLPVNELPNDPKMTQLLKDARDTVWAEQQPTIRYLLSEFTDLSAFPAECGIGPAIAGAGGPAFASLDAAHQLRVLYLLQTCSANEPRNLVALVRNFYLVNGYEGQIQTAITGTRMNLDASAEYVREHWPKLPPTRLMYDAKSGELREKDGHAIDVLIVGSGPAGAVLAHELRRGGKRVLLLERGSFVVPGSMETRLIDGLIDSRFSEDGSIRIRNGMAVGGGTQVNVDLCFAPTSDAIRTKIEGWRAAGEIGPTEFTQAELAKEYAWVRKSIGTRVLQTSEINANNHILWDGAKAEGLHAHLYDLNTYAPGHWPSPVTDKRSAESQLVIEALEDKTNPLGMVPDADVLRVLFDEQGGTKRAVGVELRMNAPMVAANGGVIADPNGLGLAPGTTVTVKAKTVILSAGALGSPTVLLRSGLTNDRIGRGIVLHPSMPILGRFAREINALKGTEASVYVDDHLIDQGYAMEAMADQPLYAAVMSPGPALHSYEMVQDFVHLGGFGVMLIDTPQDANRLVLDDKGQPIIRYTLSAADKKRFAEGIAEGIRVMFKAGAEKVYLPTTEDLLGLGGDSLQPQVLTSPDQAALVEKNLQFIANRSVVTSAHMQGTDKMGADAQTSVVGQDFHVWGTQDLYVVDGSVFPTSVGANPMQSIYTIAKIFADHWQH